MSFNLPCYIKINDFLELSLFRKDDAEALFFLGRENYNYLYQYTKWISKIQTFSDEKEFIEKCIQEYKQGLSSHFCLRLNNKIIGSISFNKIIKKDSNYSEAYLGYWLSETSQSKGYMNLAINALIREAIATTDIREFFIETGLENIKSQKLAIKNNFTLISDNNASKDKERATVLYKLSA